MGIAFKGLDHVQVCIPADMEDDAKSFYIDLLGFIEIEKPDSLKSNGGFWMQAPGVELHIGIEPGHEPGLSKRHIAFEVGDLTAARSVLEQAGLNIKEETPIPLRDRFSFRDPFGNRIELLAYHS
ncbi:VOC family protein [Bacillus marinisedimentorum]|uniref:VOC family protein n=1 Tax=Bacillus marinisedimentorum TaxID=1821260 RepID=UPI00087307F0|nr:VOC family protein [Bacillus marinisedimentorum]